MTFEPFHTNRTARTQYALVQSALTMAEYHVLRVSYDPVWHIWKKDSNKAAGYCVLTYDGTGQSLARWWQLGGLIPNQVLAIFKSCLEVSHG